MKAVPLTRINQLLLVAILTVIVLYYAKDVLIPVVFAVMLAMLMAPVCRKLDEKGCKRWLSTTLCVLLLLILLSGMVAIVAAQVASMSEELPQIEKKANTLLKQVQSEIQARFNLSPKGQMALLKEQAKSMGQSVGSYFKLVVGGFTDLLASLLLTLVYTFLMLFHKEKYEVFVLKLYTGDDLAQVQKVLDQIGKVSQQYLRGRLISIVILTVLYTIGLLIVGIKNAFLLAGVAALLTVVPYIGSLLGGFFAFAMALVTEDSFQPALAVLGVFFLVQAIDDYFIEPYVIGGEVNLSALATILSIVVGGYIWGVAGMVLFIPLLGMLKIIFDHVEGLKPYGYLLGDPGSGSSATNQLKTWWKRKFGK